MPMFLQRQNPAWTHLFPPWISDRDRSRYHATLCAVGLLLGVGHDLVVDPHHHVRDVALNADPDRVPGLALPHLHPRVFADWRRHPEGDAGNDRRPRRAAGSAATSRSASGSTGRRGSTTTGRSAGGCAGGRGGRRQPFHGEDRRPVGAAGAVDGLGNQPAHAAAGQIVHRDLVGVARLRGAEEDAAVAAVVRPDLQVELEVPVTLVGEQNAAVAERALRADDGAVHDAKVRGHAVMVVRAHVPARQVVTVEDRNETCRHGVDRRVREPRERRLDADHEVLLARQRVRIGDRRLPRRRRGSGLLRHEHADRTDEHDCQPDAEIPLCTHLRPPVSAYVDFSFLI